jgi:hypothetical protein
LLLLLLLLQTDIPDRCSGSCHHPFLQLLWIKLQAGDSTIQCDGRLQLPAWPSAAAAAAGARGCCCRRIAPPALLLLLLWLLMLWLLMLWLLLQELCALVAAVVAVQL